MMPVDINDECCHSDVTSNFLCMEAVNRKQTSCMEQVDSSTDHSSFVADLFDLSRENMSQSEVMAETYVADAEKRVLTSTAEQMTVETFAASTDEINCLETDNDINSMEIPYEMLDAEKRDKQLVDCMEQLIPETFETFESEIPFVEEEGSLQGIDILPETLSGEVLPKKTTSVQEQCETFVEEAADGEIPCLAVEDNAESEVTSDMLTVETTCHREVQTKEQFLPSSDEGPHGEIIAEIAEQGMSCVDVPSELLTVVDTSRQVADVLEQYVMTEEEPELEDTLFVEAVLPDESDIKGECESWSSVANFCPIAITESVIEVCDPDDPCGVLDLLEITVSEPDVLPSNFQNAVFDKQREVFSPELADASVFENDLSELVALQKDVLLCTDIENPFCQFRLAELSSCSHCHTGEQVCSIVEECVDGEVDLVKVSAVDNEDTVEIVLDNSNCSGKSVTHVCGGTEFHELEGTEDSESNLFISLSDSGSVKIDDSLPGGESVILRNFVNSLGICVSNESPFAEERAAIAPAAFSQTCEQRMETIAGDVLEFEAGEQRYSINTDNDGNSLHVSGLLSLGIAISDVSLPVTESVSLLPDPYCHSSEQLISTDYGLTDEFDRTQASDTVSGTDVESVIYSEALQSLPSSYSCPSVDEAPAYSDVESSVTGIVPLSDEILVNTASVANHEELFSSESNVCELVENVDADVDTLDVTQVAPVEVCSVIPLNNVASVVLQQNRCHLTDSVVQEAAYIDGSERQPAVSVAGIASRRMTLRMSTGLVVLYSDECKRLIVLHVVALC
jgi:hypothetical protein